MKKLYTWGGKFADRNLTVSDLLKNKGKKKFLQTTATNSEEARAAKEAGIDMLLCKSPLISDVRKGAPDIFLTATIDLAQFPTQDDILKEAFNAMSSGADQIYTARGPHIVEILSKEDIPVMCHLGLVPRKSSWRGGLRAIGKNANSSSTDPLRDILPKATKVKAYLKSGSVQEWFIDVMANGREKLTLSMTIRSDSEYRKTKQKGKLGAYMMLKLLYRG